MRRAPMRGTTVPGRVLSQAGATAAEVVPSSSATEVATSITV